MKVQEWREPGTLQGFLGILKPQWVELELSILTPGYLMLKVTGTWALVLTQIMARGV